MFQLKKIIGGLLLPLPAGLGLALAGLVLLCAPKRRRTGTLLITLGLLLVTAASLNPVADQLLAPLENHYPALLLSDSGPVPARLKQVRFVVVLGSSHVSDPALPITSQLEPAALARLTEGIRIQRRLTAGKLVLSGGRIDAPEANAVVMARLATALGVDRQEMILVTTPRDTKDEARAMVKVVGHRPFVLVTSASHMVRAMALFKGQGLQPIPAPTFHLVKRAVRPSWQRWLPSPAALSKSGRAVHERLGLLWARLRGQI